MAEHRVQIQQLPEVEIVNKDLVVAIFSDEAKFGEITISRGGVGWVPSGPSNERHFTWEQFARCVREWKG
jgi:hypothetical protein